TARPAPDPAADRARAPRRGAPSAVVLSRWVVLVYPGAARDLSRSRPHGPRWATAAAPLAPRPDRPRGQALRAAPGRRDRPPHGRRHAHPRRDAQTALAGQGRHQYGVHRAAERDVPGTPRAVGASVPGAGTPDPDPARGHILGGHGLY